MDNHRDRFHSCIPMALGQAPKPPKKTPELLTRAKNSTNRIARSAMALKAMGRVQLGAALKPPPSNFTKAVERMADYKGRFK